MATWDSRRPQNWEPFDLRLGGVVDLGGHMEASWLSRHAAWRTLHGILLSAFRCRTRNVRCRTRNDPPAEAGRSPAGGTRRPHNGAPLLLVPNRVEGPKAGKTGLSA